MYLMRVAHKGLINDLVADSDEEMKQTLQNILGVDFGAGPAGAWEQATLPIRRGGLGLRLANDVADAAYIASRLMCKDACMELDPHFEPGSPDDPFFEAPARFNSAQPAERHLGARVRHSEVYENNDGSKGELQNENA